MVLKFKSLKQPAQSSMRKSVATIMLSQRTLGINHTKLSISHTRIHLEYKNIEFMNLNNPKLQLTCEVLIRIKICNCCYNLINKRSKAIV